MVFFKAYDLEDFHRASDEGSDVMMAFLFRDFHFCKLKIRFIQLQRDLKRPSKVLSRRTMEIFQVTRQIFKFFLFFSSYELFYVLKSKLLFSHYTAYIIQPAIRVNFFHVRETRLHIMCGGRWRHKWRYFMCWKKNHSENHEREIKEK